MRADRGGLWWLLLACLFGGVGIGVGMILAMAFLDVLFQLAGLR